MPGIDSTRAILAAVARVDMSLMMIWRLILRAGRVLPVILMVAVAVWIDWRNNRNRKV